MEDDIAGLRADLAAAQQAYYRALDEYRVAATDRWSMAAGAARSDARVPMLEAHDAYARARERLERVLAEHRFPPHGPAGGFDVDHRA